MRNWCWLCSIWSIQNTTVSYLPLFINPSRRQQEWNVSWISQKTKDKRLTGRIEQWSCISWWRDVGIEILLWIVILFKSFHHYRFDICLFSWVGLFCLSLTKENDLKDMKRKEKEIRKKNHENSSFLSDFFTIFRFTQSRLEEREE